jgi:quercetin dioxygenase-like cupin family protein
MMVVKKGDEGIVEMQAGISRQSLAHGERTHMVTFSLEKGAVLPLHSHEEHEQTGYLVSGRMVLTIDGTDHLIEPGDSWSIDSGIPHKVRPIEDAVVIEVFSPLREDYLD